MQQVGKTNGVTEVLGNYTLCSQQSALDHVNGYQATGIRNIVYYRRPYYVISTIYNESINQAVNQSVRLVSKSASQSVNQSIYQSLNQSFDRSVGRSPMIIHLADGQLISDLNLIYQLVGRSVPPWSPISLSIIKSIRQSSGWSDDLIMVAYHKNPLYYLA